jgi:hypothetical protein
MHYSMQAEGVSQSGLVCMTGRCCVSRGLDCASARTLASARPAEVNQASDGQGTGALKPAASSHDNEANGGRPQGYRVVSIPVPEGFNGHNLICALSRDSEGGGEAQRLFGG